MSFFKDQLEREQEAGECPECGEQCELGDEGGSYCPSCDVTYHKKCSSCGQPTNDEGPVCSDCFRRQVSKDD